jgi:hypothetical protein
MAKFIVPLLLAVLLAAAPTPARADADNYSHQEAAALAFDACAGQHFWCSGPVLVGHTVQVWPYPDNDAFGNHRVRLDKFYYQYETECGLENYEVWVDVNYHKIDFWPDRFEHVAYEMYDDHSEEQYSCHGVGGGVS